MVQPRRISSPNNQHFKRWISLLDSQGVKFHHQCLVAGVTLTSFIQKTHPRFIIDIIFPQIEEPPPLSLNEINHYQLTPPLFRRLDVFGTREPILVCKVPEIPSVDLTQSPQGLEVICPIGDPGNLGALIRSCWAFGVRSVTILHEAVHPFHPKVIRGSSGAVFQQPLTRGCSLAELNNPSILRWISALDIKGQSLSSTPWPTNLRLLIGEEGGGLPSFNFAKRLSIPQFHPSIPLNSTVACSIALYDYRLQRFGQPIP